MNNGKQITQGHLSAEELVRYSRQLRLPQVGLAGQLRLKAAKVLVIGAGGLGCPVLQYLAAAGAGTIGIADGDVVEASNLQRQVLYTPQDLGRQKAIVAGEKIAALNPLVKVLVHASYVDAVNILSLVAGYDLVVDGTDNFSTRYLVNDACVMQNKPLVFGSVYQYEGQVSVFNYQGGPTYRCLFPEPPLPGEMPDCSTAGVPAPLPGVIGLLQAQEAFKIMTGAGEVLSGRLLVMDAWSMQVQLFNVNVVAANRQLDRLPGALTACPATAQPSVTYPQLLQLQGSTTVQLVDVREPAEHAAFHIGGVNIPLGQILAGCVHLSRELPLVLYCAYGVRSSKACAILRAAGFSRVMQLQNGIMHLAAAHIGTPAEKQ